MKAYVNNKDNKLSIFLKDAFNNLLKPDKSIGEGKQKNIIHKTNNYKTRNNIGFATGIVLGAGATGFTACVMTGVIAL